MIQELVSRGEEILYVLTDRYRTKVEATGARYVPYPDIPDIHDVDRWSTSGNIPQNARRLVQLGENLLPFMFDLMEREKPDYLIMDF